MKLHAHPKPLTAPLSGGTQGATVVVEPVSTGQVRFPKASFERDEGRFTKLKTLFGREKWEVPCPAFIVRHPTAGLILVDTGLHPSIATDPKQNYGRLASWYAKPAQQAGEDLPARLRARGVEARQVNVVIMTHLHQDHASGISEFGNATFVVTAAEWDAATRDPGPGAMHGYRLSNYDFVFDYRTVDFSSVDVDSYASFGRTFDLFGDGSVRLAYTPGHTAGHQSVILKLKRRDFVIAGDAIYTYRQLEGGPMPGRLHDEHNWNRSLQELQLYHRDYPHALIVPGHDPAYWPKLEARYEE
ncbi:MAG: N-acyl homoserine lactone hydrolase [Solirubrobacterales bacterium]|jgi:glyoxylase-like metal-dependent hydrolase (beta-lactamase superfamily II)|nr:N-acyl homoserine lactone hydrolase [Solirubrobacterales bacterium]